MASTLLKAGGTIAGAGFVAVQIDESGDLAKALSNLGVPGPSALLPTLSWPQFSGLFAPSVSASRAVRASAPAAAAPAPVVAAPPPPPTIIVTHQGTTSSGSKFYVVTIGAAVVLVLYARHKGYTWNDVAWISKAAFSATIKGVESAIAKTQEAVAKAKVELEARISEVRADVCTVRDDVRQAKTQLREDIAETRADLGHVRDGVAGVAESVEAVGTSLDALRESAATRDQVDELRETMGGMESASEQLSGAIDVVQLTALETQQSVGAIESSIGQLQKEHQAGVALANQAVCKMQAQMQAQMSKIDRIEAAVTKQSRPHPAQAAEHAEAGREAAWRHGLDVSRDNLKLSAEHASAESSRGSVSVAAAVKTFTTSDVLRSLDSLNRQPIPSSFIPRGVPDAPLPKHATDKHHHPRGLLDAHVVPTLTLNKFLYPSN